MATKERTAQIRYRGIVGTISYREVENDGEVEFAVVLDDANMRRRISQYLGKREKTYKDPQSKRIDDYIEVTVVPKTNWDYFERALCTLAATLNVWVNW